MVSLRSHLARVDCGLRIADCGLAIFRFPLSAFRFFLLLRLFAALFLRADPAHAEDFAAPWLAAQTNIHTWSAAFRQTRTFKALTQPLLSEGHVWFNAPQRFRWELGEPAQTIAVRQTDQMLVIYPQLKRVERYPLGGEQRNPWQDTLALLEAGFPRSAAEVEARFRVLSV